MRLCAHTNSELPQRSGRLPRIWGSTSVFATHLSTFHGYPHRHIKEEDASNARGKPESKVYAYTLDVHRPVCVSPIAVSPAVLISLNAYFTRAAARCGASSEHYRGLATATSAQGKRGATKHMHTHAHAHVVMPRSACLCAPPGAPTVTVTRRGRRRWR